VIDDFRVVYQVSARRICKLFGFSKSSYYYKQVIDHQAIVIKQRMKDIAAVRVRYGYRRIHVLLKREGISVSVKRIYRLYCELNLQLRNKTPRRRVQAVIRRDAVVATARNDCWSMDFMADQLFTGTKIRLLTVVDNYTRLSPAIGIGYSYKACDVVFTLEEAVLNYGKPKVIKVDNGPEFISKELDMWAYSKGVRLDYSRPGKPTDNAFIESFNSSVRQECLNQHWFLTLEDAATKIESWREDYNTVRPHRSLGYQTPMEFANLA
jgi:putative transposase